MEAFCAAGTRNGSSYGFGMAVRTALLPVLGDVDKHRLLRFDLICSALTSVYFTWFIGSYENMTLDEVNTEIVRIIRTESPTNDEAVGH